MAEGNDPTAADAHLPPEMWAMVLRALPGLWRPVAARVCRAWWDAMADLVRSSAPRIPDDAPRGGPLEPGAVCPMPLADAGVPRCGDCRFRGNPRGGRVSRALWLRCALLVDAEGERNRIVSSVQVTKGYYWDCDAMRNEIVASYFPTARHVIDEALRRAEWDADDISLVLPHNVSTRSWEILLGLIGIPRERLWDRNIARVGHTLAGDNFINLRDAIDDGGVNAGDRLLLFSYGYGAHWSALMLEA